MASMARFKDLKLDESLFKLFAEGGIRANNIVRSSQGTFFGYLIEAKHDQYGQCVLVLVPSVVLPSLRDTSGKEFLPPGTHTN